MGNNLCAPWRKDYRDENNPWAPKKDSHLLRLWAEIFQVEEDDGDICWARVSDDVVPTNITCIADNPETVFQITSYNRHVEKIFDVKLIQPGTRITQASECFVHWKDSRSGHEWGLNFTTPGDARRFRDCCMKNMPKLWRKGSLSSFRDNIRKAPTTHGYARKASSSGSLRLSPPKRVRGRKATSNPTSPITEPKRAFSNPEDIAHRDGIYRSAEAENHIGPQKRNGVSNHGIEYIATAPRCRNRNIPTAHSVFEHEHCSSNSNSSSYDNVGNVTLRRKQKVECDSQCPHYSVTSSSTPKTKYRPIGEREIPFSEYEHLKCRQKQTNSEDQAQSHYSSGGSTKNSLEREGKYGKTRGDRITEEEEHRESDYEEVRQFSREPTCIHLSAGSESENQGYYSGNDKSEENPYTAVLKSSKNNVTETTEVQKISINSNNGSDESTHSNNSSGKLLSPPRKSLSSSSPEWPPPPESLDEPASPFSPGLPGGFDSNTLKRMLQNLPECRSDNGKEQRLEYKTLPNQSSNKLHDSISKSQTITRRPPLSQDKHSFENGTATKTMISSAPDTSVYMQPFELKSPPVKPNRMGLDSTDLKYRKSKMRDSYPDSGISGMTNDTTGSVKSGDSGRSGHSGRSTLPPGLGLSSLRSKSSAHSSGGSSSGRQSDFIRQSTTGSETTEVRQLTTSDMESDSCESESEQSDSSIHTMCTESQSTLASRSAAVRKAGWLTVKNWLIHKKRKVELAPRRTWKKYWVCLKGTALLFYVCDDNESVNEDSVPRHMLVIEQGIAQGVPEHPKRENIFALSTAFGDAYLFEAPSQIELENWINGIHSACASSFARQHGKENTLKLLRSEIQKLENSIDLDIKMKKMAGLQLNVVVDTKSKQAIEKQILQWNENLEKLYIEQYRLRCYMASLQGSELPNPKNLLSCVSKQTKAVLSRVGVFTVSAFHALVCARAPLNTATIYAAGNKNKKGIMSTFKADNVAARIRPRSPMAYSQPAAQSCRNSDVTDHVVVDLQSHEDESPQLPMEAYSFCDNLLRVQLPNEQYVVLGISEKMTVAEILEMACNKRQLNPTDYFIRIKMPGSDSYKIPEKSVLLSSEEFDACEVCQKILFQLDLSRDPGQEFGMAVEAELAEDTEEEDELCVFVSDVVKGSVAYKKGVQVGDELLVMNSKVIKELDMVYVENLLQDELSLTMTIRSCRVERPVSTTKQQEHADVYIENMMCPPPPSQSRISDQAIGELIIPAPNWVNAENSGSDHSTETTPRVVKEVQVPADKEIDSLLVGADQVTQFCRLLHEPFIKDNSGQAEEGYYQQVKPMNESQRIRKVIVELVETERQYVKDLNCLIERYLEPLKEETFLSNEDIEALFGNIQEIVQFQKMFLQSLEEAIELEPDFDIFSEARKFKDDELRRVLFSVGGSFLYYANHFKLYSSFCASHSRAQKVLTSDENVPLQNFLRARNPKQQHSATMESYLIKPIQRILKYPLLLKQLKGLTDSQSDQHLHLTEALKGMETVAEHINEMQKIYEEYGGIFDDLGKQYKESRKKVLDINVGDLQMYGNVNWLNALDELGKIKKGTDIVTMLFVFKSGVVILAQERVKGKRRPRNLSQGRVNGCQDPSDVIRFQSGVAVDELQVRTVLTESGSERHGLWELVHCRSEKEGRPEKIFQFASSLEARKDFLRTIHSAIRESVRKMSIPGSKVPTSGVSAGNGVKPRVYAQNSPAQHPRPDSFHSQSFSPQQLHSSQYQSGTNQTKSGYKMDMGRYSMNIEDRVDSILESRGGGPHQHECSDGGKDVIRSQTLSDLHNMGLCDQKACQSSGSQSTLTSETSHTGGAKLLHSSNKPSHYQTHKSIACNSNQNSEYNSQNSSKHRDGLGSPIWKPRTPAAAVVAANSSYNSPQSRHSASHHHQQNNPHSTPQNTTTHMYAGSAYGNYASIVYDDKNSAVLLTPPNTTLYDYDDTDC